jgi:multiple sugar transport system permease protein
MYPSSILGRPPAIRALYFGGVALALAVWLLPLVAVAMISMRSADDLNRGIVWGWPADLRVIENYLTVIGGSREIRFMLNSFLIAVPSVIGTVLLSSMAGFALAKHHFPGNRLLLLVFVAGNLVPFQVLMIPVRDLTIALGIYDTRTALILFHTAFQTGFCTLFMRNFIREIPDSVLDIARVEGASEVSLFRHIVLPMTRPAIAAVSVLIFTFVWNDFFWALVLVQSDAIRPLTAGLQGLRGMWQTSWNLVAAASLLAALPPVAIFFAMQRHVIAGLTITAGSEGG